MKSFEEWLKASNINTAGDPCLRECMEDAYRADMMRAAEIARDMTEKCPYYSCPQYTDADDCSYRDTGFCIESQIRKEAGDD